MSHKEVLATINLAHYFKSAFTSEQTYRYLKIGMPSHVFEAILAELKSEGLVTEKNGVLFTKDLEKLYRQKQEWSRTLFDKNRKHLGWIAKISWIKFAALTGANAFESCAQKDDIDLFFVTKKNRLWLCYLLLVVLSKIWRKRGLLCVNYLVDENNLHTSQQDYYTAVQIVQMIPLFDNEIAEKLVAQNQWIFDFLPNAKGYIARDDFYILRNGHNNRNGKLEKQGILTALNRVIYQKYDRRLARKYPQQYGSGIVLREGVAKLNRVNHQDIYENVYQKIYHEIETTLPT